MNKILLIFLLIGLLCGIYWYYMKYNNELESKKKKISLRKNIFDSEESFDSKVLDQTASQSEEKSESDNEEENIYNESEINESKHSTSNNTQNSLHSSHFKNSENQSEYNLESMDDW